MTEVQLYDAAGDAEPPQAHPAYEVPLDGGHGPTVKFQAVPFDHFFAETPHADFTYRVVGDENDMSFTYRTLLSDEELSAMIDALTHVQREARQQAALFGWEPSDG